MQRYYRTKQAVLQLNSVLLQNMRARLFPEAGITYRLPNALWRDDLLEARSENCLNASLCNSGEFPANGKTSATQRIFRSHSACSVARTQADECILRRDPTIAICSCKFCGNHMASRIYYGA